MEPASASAGAGFIMGAGIYGAILARYARVATGYARVRSGYARVLKSYGAISGAYARLGTLDLLSYVVSHHYNKGIDNKKPSNV